MLTHLCPMALGISEDRVVTLLKNALTNFGRSITKIAPIIKGLLENVGSRGYPVAVAVDWKVGATFVQRKDNPNEACSTIQILPGTAS